MLSSPLFVLTILCLSVVVSEWLVKRTFLKHLGTALVVILFVAILANVGLLPSASEGSVVYTGIFKYLAPLSIFYLLLDVNLASIRKAGAPMLLLFGMGSTGTVLGVLAGMWLIDGATHFGNLYPAISGMFTGTYSGGSVNFNAVAIHYNMMQQGALYAGMTAVDNIITAIWMVVTLAVPMLLRRAVGTKKKVAALVPENVEREYESISIISLGVLLSVGLGALFVSQLLAGWLSGMGLMVPSILILTTIALVLAQFPVFHRLAGGQVIGLFCVYLFLAVIGAFCELAALGQIGVLAWRLLALVVTIVVVHGAVVFGVAAIGKLDWDTAAVASQANIGGSSSALALAKSLDRMDLYLPGILVGSLGNGLGTYLGFMVAGWLG
ncbi:MAG: putative membrane protein [Neolewinella sp.]|jgi:uncharacterized membrane protein